MKHLLTLAMVMWSSLAVVAWSADDDWFITSESQETQTEPQVINLDQQLQGLFQGEIGKLQNRQWMDRTQALIEGLERVCTLTADQRQRLEIAARLDELNRRERMESFLARFRGQTIEMNSRQGQKKWQEFTQELPKLQQAMQHINERESLLHAVMRHVLNDSQRRAWDAEQQARQRGQWQAIVAAGLAQVDNSAGLTQAQYDQLERLVLENPLRVQASALRAQPYYLQQAAWIGLSKVDDAAIREWVSPQQLKAIRQIKQQGQAMIQHLRQQGFILD